MIARGNKCRKEKSVVGTCPFISRIPLRKIQKVRAKTERPALIHAEKCASLCFCNKSRKILAVLAGFKRSL